MVDINDQDSRNKTALMNAIIKGQEDIANYLITNGANSLIRDMRETTCLHEVTQQAIFSFIKYKDAQ
jgi:ankyrin repeat protein